MFVRLLLCCAALSALALQLIATTVKPPTFSELVNGADFIVHARVKSVSYTVKGRAGQQPLIFTQVELELQQTVAGTPPEQIVLTCLGGKADGVELRVEGTPQFAVGDEDILFVQGNGRVFFPLYALMHGRYLVRRDEQGREYVARANDVPMSDVAEVAAPMTTGSSATLQRKMISKASALSPAEFIAQIQEVRRAR